MERPGSRTAGYLIGAVLLIPLVLLGLFFAAYVGSLGLLVASALLVACLLTTWFARVRIDRRQSLG